MELIPIECGNCKAKLKIKAMPARMPTEVKCPKCGKPIPVGKGAPAAAATPVQAPSVPATPAPVASTPFAPIAATPVVLAPPPQAAPAVVAPAAPVVAPVTPVVTSPAAAASDTAQLTTPPKPMQQAPSSSPVSTAKKAAAPIVLGQVPDASSGANIPVVCPACQWQTKVSQTLIGKKIKCKQCSGIIPVTLPEPAAAAKAPVAEPVIAVPPAPVAPIEPPAPAAIPVAPLPVPPPPAPAPTPVVEEVVPRLQPEPSPLPTPVAKWTPPEVSLNEPLSTARTSPGTTVLVGEIATLKSKLESATKESSRFVMRLDEAEKKVQYAEMRVQEAEHALHDLAGKAAIDAMTANRKIADLEAKVAPLESKIAALNQLLASITDEFGPELLQAEKSIARLKDIMASRNLLGR